MRERMHYTKHTKTHARNLRKEMTKEERLLWFSFLSSYPLHFYRQRRIDNYIVDFYNGKARLAIEIDGSQHYDPDEQAYEDERTRCLARYGIGVIRFTNLDIQRNFKGVCEKIHEIMQERCGEEIEWKK